MSTRAHITSSLASSAIIAAIFLTAPLTTATAAAAPAQGAARRTEHAITGEVKRVDHQTKTLVIHTADGVDETMKFTERTTVHGVKDVAKVSDKAAKGLLEGSTAVIVVTGEGMDRTAVEIGHVGKHPVRLLKGTVVRVDEGGKYLVVKTAAGAEETVDLSKDVIVDSGKGLDRAAVASARGLDKGTEVTVHYSDEGGKKLAHLIKHL
jgi:Cu/Ag efflux protein CusF